MKFHILTVRAVRDQFEVSNTSRRLTKRKETPTTYKPRHMSDSNKEEITHSDPTTIGGTVPVAIKLGANPRVAKLPYLKVT